MKINKIICDVCENELNLEIDEALGMFEFIQTQTKLNLIPTLSQIERNPEDTNKEIIKTSFDLCKRCALLVEEFLKNKKETLKK